MARSRAAPPFPHPNASVAKAAVSMMRSITKEGTTSASTGKSDTAVAMSQARASITDGKPNALSSRA